MKLLRVHVIKADTCGGLLDGLDLRLRDLRESTACFDPLCLIGPNGAGKSQMLQVIAEAFQSTFHAIAPNLERIEGNPNLEFELEYLIRISSEEPAVHVRIARKSEGKRKPVVAIATLGSDREWKTRELSSSLLNLLPSKIVGYTSGDNETLSLPFLQSRSGYAEEVRTKAFAKDGSPSAIPDTRLMLIDYGTHLEVLVANLILAGPQQVNALLQDAHLTSLYSFRCIVQLAHSAVSRASRKRKPNSTRKGIQLTDELETYIDRLQRCATCFSYDSRTETYTFDFFVDEQTGVAFRSFWDNAIHLYSSLHKLAMLNDLAIPRTTRDRFKRETKERRFASRLPEPQDEHKVFRFEQVKFRAQNRPQIVDYVSLSDGEHQQAQLLGTFSMLSFPGVLFLLDEPESHFNPQWRVKFMSRLLDLPTSNGTRRGESAASQQDGLLTTHAPFVPSDMKREHVLIFGKENGRVVVRRPDIETFGTTFDAILDECFDVRPPISEEPRKEIERLMKSQDATEIKEGMDQLGPSVEKAFLAEHLSQIPTPGQD